MILINLITMGSSISHILEFGSDNIAVYDKSKMYTLHIYDHRNYKNLYSCLLTEYKPSDDKLLEELKRVEDEYYYTKKMDEKDLSDILLNKSDPLTFDEKFAIYLNTRESDPRIYYEMRDSLPSGLIGRFNCFFDYYMKGFQKIKPISKNMTLYRGASIPEINVFSNWENFKKGTYVSTNSLTPTSASLPTAIDIAHSKGKTPYVIFKISACRNPRDIRLLSSMNEEEYIYPPSTRFRITSDPYSIWCTYSGKDCGYEKKDDYFEHIFLDLDEIDDEYGPYVVTQRPTPSQSPYPTSTPNPTFTPSPTPSYKKKGSSSGGNETPQTSSLILGNIPLNVVYIGGSSIFDLPINFRIIRKMRNLLRHFIPLPVCVHTAIWSSTDDSDDETIGAVFVYGKYHSIENDSSFISEDGARTYIMSLGEFKQYFDGFTVKKLIPKRKITLFSFINELKSSGNWKANQYNWPNNNCQHFTNTCLKILKASSNISDTSYWLNLPPFIIKTIKENEKIGEE